MKIYEKSLDEVFPTDIDESDVYFVCIGTDRSTGDSLGPLVGTNLVRLGYTNVIGTIDEPCHAMNLEELVAEIPEGKLIIGIDSALGSAHRVGKISFGKYPIRPGAATGKELPTVGDYSISGIVNVSGFMEYFVLQNTRLSLVMKMADRITEMIDKHFVYPRFNSQIAATMEE